MTPDTSMRIGIHDFNPEDFSYEFHNIVRLSENTLNDPTISNRSKENTTS